MSSGAHFLFHSFAKSYYLRTKVTFKMQFSVHATMSDMNCLMKATLSKDTFAVTT